jgi:small subunit ribosomal protein S4e
VCESFKEARKLLSTRQILVDGKVCTDAKRGLGFMDVLSFTKVGKFYRVLLDRRGKIRFVEITQDRAGWKLCRINSKVTAKGGKIQLGLHDGRSILMGKEDAKKYARGDTLKITVPDQKILDHYPFKPGFVSMVVGGKHTGKHALIASAEVVRSTLKNRVVLEGDINTVKNHVFVVGKTHPEIKLLED